MLFCAQAEKGIVRVNDLWDLLAVNKMCVNEVQDNSRISVISEKLIMVFREKFPHLRERFPQFEGQYVNVLGECVHIVHHKVKQ